jgi:hypothetical protein
MRTLLTLIAGANLIALNLFIFFKVPNLEAGSSGVAIALVVVYLAGFVGAAAGSLLYRK